MESEARALSRYNYGSAAPTLNSLIDAETKKMPAIKPAKPVVKERTGRLEKVKAIADAKTVPGISVFAILGTIFVAVLMVFSVLAQINYNEAAVENVKLKSHISDLKEKQKMLELTFERVVDIREIERYAGDELSMSRPDAGQIISISTIPRDTAVIFPAAESREEQGFGAFIRSLTDYFRK